MIEIWSKPNCVFCDKAEMLCKMKSLEYKKYMLDVDYSREDFMDKFPEAIADLMKWVQEGKIIYQEDIQEGIENAPSTLLRLYTGKNQGKQLLKVADPD